ncbi:MAG: hypothetical protein V3U14_13030 [candidate division NC10 bacterium]
MPQWKHKIDLSDIFNDEDRTFLQCRDAIVTVLRADTWLAARFDDDDELYGIVDELNDTDTEEWFNSAWNAFYDWADGERLWVNTI